MSSLILKYKFIICMMSMVFCVSCDKESKTIDESNTHVKQSKQRSKASGLANSVIDGSPKNNSDNKGVDKLSEEWNMALAEVDLRKKRAALELVVSQLCEKENYVEALNLIALNMPESGLRTKLLEEFFGGHFAVPFDLRLDLLDDKSLINDKLSLCRHLCSSIASLSSLAEVDMMKLQSKVKDNNQILQGLALYSYGHPGSEVENASLIKDIFKVFDSMNFQAQESKNQSMNYLYSSLAVRYPFEVWNEYIQIDGSKNSELLNSLTTKMASFDIAKTATLLIASPDYINPNILIDHWGRNDSQSFKIWSEKNIKENKLSQEVISSAKSKLIELEFNQSNVRESWAKLKTITDPKARENLEKRLWSKERNMVQNSVKAEPQKALEELVSGTSVHDSYWIEEAMDVWMQKDFDKAEKWYGDNWKSLPAEKAQYAAAAFAKNAIKAGDVDAAAQWLPYIQDPKTKARIQADVDKALSKQPQ